MLIIKNRIKSSHSTMLILTNLFLLITAIPTYSVTGTPADARFNEIANYVEEKMNRVKSPVQPWASCREIVSSIWKALAWITEPYKGWGVIVLSNTSSLYTPKMA